MAEKDSGVAQAEADLAVAQAKLEVVEAKLLLAKSKEGSPKETELGEPYARWEKEANELIAREKTMEDAAEEYKLVCENSTYTLEYLLSDLRDIIKLHGARKFVIGNKPYYERKAFFKFIESLNLNFNEDELVLEQVENCLRTRIRYEQEETPEEKARIELDKKNDRFFYRVQ